MDVKKDIRRLRAVKRQITLLEGARDKYDRRILALMRAGTDTAEREAEKLRRIRNGLKIPELKAEEERLLQTYEPVMEKLSPVDHMVLEQFIDGATHQEIAIDLGYSEVGVRKRLDRVYKKIACPVANK